MEMKVNAILQRADILMDQKRFKDAERFIGEALGLEPQNAEALAMLARCYINDNKFEEAREALNKALAVEPNNAYYHYIQGVAYFRQSLHADAAGSLLHAISLKPVAEYYGLLAYVYLNERFNELALSKANEGLAIDPANITSLNARSVALKTLRRKSEAESTIMDALAKAPENRLTYRTFGWHLLSRGRSDEAEQKFLEALRLHPEDSAAKNGLKESLKSRLFFYRWLILSGRWLFGPAATYLIFIFLGLVLLIWFPIRNVIALDYITGFFAVFGSSFILSVVIAGVFDSIADFIISWHPRGRFTLTAAERWSSFFVTAFFLGGILLMLLYALAPFAENAPREKYLFVAGLASCSLAFVVRKARFAPRRENDWRQALTLVVSLMGVATLVLFAIAYKHMLPVFVLYWCGFIIWFFSGASSLKAA